MRVAMIGSGYVGLVSGACFADFGHDRHLRRQGRRPRSRRCIAGEMPIFEPGLAELVANNVRERAAVASRPSSPRRSRSADAVFIAVGTPSRRGDGHADLSYVYQRGPRDRGGARRLHGRRHQVDRAGRHRRRGRAHHPRRPGPRPNSRSSPIRNSCARARRSAISSGPTASSSAPTTSAAREVMTELYRPLYLNQAPMLFTARRTAELTKYAANAFLATKITFINEIADLCEQVGANVQDVARGIGLDNRIGSKFLHAGPGLWRLVLSQGYAGAGQDRRRTTARRCASSRRWWRSTSSASAPWPAR